MIVFVCLITGQGESPGWSRVAAMPSSVDVTVVPAASRAPAIIVAWCLVGCGAMIGLLTVWSTEGQLILGLFSFILLALATAVFVSLRKFTPETDEVVVDARV